MRVRLIAFTAVGERVALRARDALEGEECGYERGFGEGRRGLDAFAREGFAEADALVFVGAVGIAVRAVAPYVRSKASDPAVVAIDEAGTWCIPILSGHLGGANALALRLARALGAQPVVTTATDIRGMWAPDSWAASQGFCVLEPERIRSVSSSLLAGAGASLFTDGAVEGALPVGVSLADERTRAQVVVSPCALAQDGALAPGPALHIVPPCVYVGVGCRRGTSEAAIARAVERAGELAGVPPCALAGAASVDLKADEEGLLRWARSKGLAIEFFDADRLGRARGSFSSSPFVESVTGVGCVCERAAVCASGAGRLICTKQVFDGVTVALAASAFTCTFNSDAAYRRG